MPVGLSTDQAAAEVRTGSPDLARYFHLDDSDSGLIRFAEAITIG
jgi:hypothetical protein